MRERPILFSGPMVRAILAGRKTVTRRVVKPQPPEDDAPLATGWFHPETADGGPGPHTFGVYGVDWHVRCPYGAPNDRLWVRETFAPNYFARGLPGYRTDWDGRFPEPRWRPSIFMRRHESRITLEVVSVRVERLQEITEEDALAEGVMSLSNIHPIARPTSVFQELWDQINGKRAPWVSNPWVWRVEFRRVT